MKNEWNKTRKNLSTQLARIQREGTRQSEKDIKERERIIKERQAKIDICLNCKRECKYGICEFFPHG